MRFPRRLNADRRRGFLSCCSLIARRHSTHAHSTLRQLERDGLISRRDFGEKPYALTELGIRLLVQMIPLWTWVIEQSEGVNEAHKRYDER